MIDIECGLRIIDTSFAIRVCILHREFHRIGLRSIAAVIVLQEGYIFAYSISFERRAVEYLLQWIGIKLTRRSLQYIRLHKRFVHDIERDIIRQFFPVFERDGLDDHFDAALSEAVRHHEQFVGFSCPISEIPLHVVDIRWCEPIAHRLEIHLLPHIRIEHIGLEHASWDIFSYAHDEVADSDDGSIFAYLHSDGNASGDRE